jgi:spoIIIJ-associated protein
VREVVESGKSIDEAVEHALLALSASRDQVTIDILEEPKRGLLGIGAKKATVKVTLKETPAEAVTKYIEAIVEHIGQSVEVNVTQVDDRTMEIQLAGDDLAILIGKRGHTLNALQYLANLVANKAADHKMKIVLDAEDYRSRRQEALEHLAERMAARAVRERKSLQLDPMPAYERKIIHTSLQNYPGITTSSNGEEPVRYVVIHPSLSSK